MVRAWAAYCAIVVLGIACSTQPQVQNPPEPLPPSQDGGSPRPADGGAIDGGTTLGEPDAGANAGTDGGSPRPADGGAIDGGTTLGDSDAGASTGTDGGSPHTGGDAGPEPSPGVYVPPIDLSAPEWTDVRTLPRACAVAEANQVCTLDCFCWENPRPHGDTVHSIAATSRGTYFGVHNGILLWDGAKFVNEPVPSATYFSVSAADDEVWAAAGDTLVRFDGRQWSPIPLPGDRHTQVLTPAPGEAWTISFGGGAYRWRRGEWQNMRFPSADPNWLDGTAPNDVWVATPRAVHQFDGAGWVERTPTGKQIVDFGVSDDGVLAKVQWNEGLTAREATIQWNGEDWTEVALPGHFTLSEGLRYGARGVPGGGVEALRQTVDGWEAMPLPGATFYIRFAITGGGVWVFGEEGYLARLEAGSFVPKTPLAAPAGGSAPAWTNDDDLHVGVYGSVIAWNGSTLRVLSFPVSAWSLARAPDGTLWMTTRGEVVQYDGATEVARVPDPAGRMDGIAVTADGTLWSYRGAGIEYFGQLYRHVPGAGWKEEVAPEITGKYLGTIAAAGPELWVTASGKLFRWTKAEWTKEQGPACVTTGACGAERVVATAANDVWLETSGGVFRFDGLSWKHIASKGRVTLSGRGEAWLQWFGAASGQPDTAYWDGTRWQSLRAPQGTRLSVARGRLSAFLPDGFRGADMPGTRGTRLEFRPGAP